MWGSVCLCVCVMWGLEGGWGRGIDPSQGLKHWGHITSEGGALDRHNHRAIAVPSLQKVGEGCVSRVAVYVSHDRSYALNGLPHRQLISGIAVPPLVKITGRGEGRKWG